MKEIRQSDDGVYTFWNDDKQLLTPRGLACSTKSRKLADRILSDWIRHGESFSGASALPWQFTYQDNFLPLGEEGVRNAMIESFITPNDWTLCCNPPSPKAYMHFRAWFGSPDSRLDELQRWLGGLNLNQLTAACCVGNAFESLNVAYVLSLIHQQFKEEEKKIAAVKEVGQIVRKFLGVGISVKRVFSLFEMYWEGNVAE